MQIITYLITGIILAVADFYIEDNQKPSEIIKKLFYYTILFNIVSLNIFKYGFKEINILESSLYTPMFCIKYLALTLLLGAIFLFIKAILISRIVFTRKLIFSKPSKTFKKRFLFLQITIIFLFVLGMTFLFFSDWFTNYFGEMTPEQFLFNLKSPLKGTSEGSMKEIFTSPVFAIASAATVFLAFINFKYEISVRTKKAEKKILSQKYFRVISLILAIVFCGGGVAYGVEKLSLDEVVTAYLSDSSYIADNYVDPRDVKMSFPEKKRNLIHIYLESVENSYFSEELGGHMKVNLMPELTQLSKEGISFSNNDTFGGPYETYGSSWSVASMINMGAGIPLKIPMKRNTYGKNGSFLPGAITIGDILEAQGYNQTIMFGADADFGGLTTYFNTHGNFNIFDYKAAIEKKLISDDYYVWWGYEDDKLYEYAKGELTRLHNEGKPFNFTMETADTHFPDGHLSPNAEQKHDSQYANVISYSTKEAVKFIRWIQEQPFYENTTIVVTGDHLSMDRDFFTNFDKSYNRSIYNLILNSPVSTDNTANREFAPFDMFPTILSSMGVQIDGNALGLGVDLFSNKKTLIEEQGIKNVEAGLGSNSNFFTDKFVAEKGTSIFENTNVTERKGE